MEHYEDAVRCHKRAIELAPKDLRTHSGYAATLKQAQDIPASTAACRRALTLEPDNVPMLLLLAGNLAAQGQFQQAVETYRRILELDPGCTDAQRGMVSVGAEIDAAERTRLEALVDAADVPEGRRIAAGFALGSLLDRLGEYDAAFRYIAAANRLAAGERKEAGKAFDRDALRQQVDTLIDAFPAGIFADIKDWGVRSELPVFIVGMPRSGTTLAEQIVASHPLAAGAGERKEIGHISKNLAIATYPSPMLWDRGAVRSEAETHLAFLRRFGSEALRIVDKMPDNIFNLGLIAVLFPRARVVIARRDPRDVCLSCHFQSFSAGLGWSNDLADCAFRVRETERLIRHWRAVLPLPMFEVQYERLVADLEGESRRLIEFLGLDWDPACLEFHKTERAIVTASLWQVRQPLYTRSVERWRHYHESLQPLVEALGDLLPADAAKEGQAGIPQAVGLEH
jgi:tetratricopeptide (TPR) repeat protein